TELFDDVELWEPGAVVYETLEVVNEGTLALKYQLSVNVANATATTDGKTLADVLKVGVIDGGATITDRDALIGEVKDWSSLASFTENGDLEIKESYVYTVVIYWEPSENDNEFNMNNDNKVDALTVEIGVNLYATQLDSESDSFGKDYDVIDIWDGSVDTDIEQADGYYVITSAEELAGFAKLVNDGAKSAKAKLTTNVDLAGLSWTPISTSWAYSGTFDGQGYMVSNMNVNSYEAGLFGVATGTVKNVNVDNAYVVGDYHAAAIVGTGYASVQNCKVTNSTIVGNYAGALGGYSASGTNTGNSVDNCVIAGTYAVGGLYGLVTADGSNSITDNSVKNSSIYCSAPVGSSYNGVGEVVGRIASDVVVLENNTTENNTVYEGVDFWDGSIDTEIEKVDGVYSITSAEELAGFAALVNNGEKSAKAILTTDVNLAGLSWTPIATSWAYSGTFDGQGHTISNMNVESYEAGLFGVATGTVKNVNIDGAYVVGDYHAAAIVGTGYASVQNCKVTNSTIIGNYAGALGGYSAAGKNMENSVDNCVISGKYAVGGLYGLVTADGSNTISNNTVTNCTISCEEPTGNYYNGIGEIVGRVANSSVVLENNTAENNTLN
ncbi:MAG: hypothetical protein IJ011_03690, partial [Clostridia bacterium]|nr:hypothetical protein [Clostridia bacterium]